MTLDRDAAREVLKGWWPRPMHRYADDVLDALEGCVRPVPAQTIDRDELRNVLLDYDQAEASTEQTVTAVLALMRPVDDLVITCDEAVEITYALDTGGGIHYSIYKKLTTE